MADLKTVYKAATKNTANITLDDLAAERDILSVYFKYLEDERITIYTTNAVEAVHRQFHKLTKTKGGFANENSLLNLLYAEGAECV